MIDGIKIYCEDLSPQTWERMPYLSFITIINEQTGEILNKKRYAQYQALYLEIKPSTIIKNKDNCYLHGSIAKYHNNGLDNAYDYDYQAFQNTLTDLENKLKINPEKAQLKNFEFGINITLPFPVKTALNHLKTYKSNSFSTMYTGRQNIGYIADYQQYTLKIYNKSIQAKINQPNLLRIEIQVKKMQYVKALNIHTLADLKKPEIWKYLANHLLNLWAECLYINEKDFNYKTMSDRTQKKFLRFIDPRYWDSLKEKKQRLRARQAYKKICNHYQNKEEKQIITTFIKEKLEKLKPKTVHQLTNPIPLKTVQNDKPNQKIKCPPFNPLDKELISTQNKNINKDRFLLENIKQKKPEKQTQKHIKKCLVCHQSLKNKNTHAKYCSKQCNNQYHTRKRKKMRQKIKITQIKNLNRIIQQIPKNNLWLTITYTNKKLTYTETLHQSEILSPAQWINKIKQIEIKGIRKNSPIITLTSLRAKKLIKQLTLINQKHTKNTLNN
ncbi:hypothetical protein ETU10_03280 [Apibacter muscae]|uniref:hypothetical protein n=1 Tax=Apibacter muscae TaxID=2509004 RepID=UPI0011AC98FA|nr:hypothetical protein [Apibacter muscae]TWP24280.1 hypothetical protein ETU10_03280 [Apibacter muscae]